MSDDLALTEVLPTSAQAPHPTPSCRKLGCQAWTLVAENERLRGLLQDWREDCLNEDCTLCHRTSEALA